MNSKARVVAKKHKKKVIKMKEKQTSSEVKKVLNAIARGYLYLHELEKFKRTLKLIDMGRYATYSEEKCGARFRITLTAPEAWIECMRHSFHNDRNGSMNEWGDRFRVSTL